MRRLLPLVLLVLLLPGCSHQERVCTLMGGEDTLFVTVDPMIQKTLTTIRVQLRQGGAHGRVSFPASDPRGGVPGVIVHRNGKILLKLRNSLHSTPAALPGAWKAGRPARLTIEGLRDGFVSYRHQEIFRFSHAYPNGKGCRPDVLVHATTVGSKDKLAAPGRPDYSVNLQSVDEHIVDIASRHPGFAGLVNVARERSVTVIWSGHAPQELRDYAAPRPQHATIKVREHARFSRAELEAGRDRLIHAHILNRLKVVGMSVPVSGRALIIETMRTAFTPATLELLRRTAGVAVEVKYGVPEPELY